MTVQQTLGAISKYFRKETRLSIKFELLTWQSYRLSERFLVSESLTIFTRKELSNDVFMNPPFLNKLTSKKYSKLSKIHLKTSEQK